MIAKDNGIIKIVLTKKEVERIKKMAAKEDRSISNMAAVLIRKSL